MIKREIEEKTGKIVRTSKKKLAEKKEYLDVSIRIEGDCIENIPIVGKDMDKMEKGAKVKIIKKIYYFLNYPVHSSFPKVEVLNKHNCY